MQSQNKIDGRRLEDIKGKREKDTNEKENMHRQDTKEIGAKVIHRISHS